MAGPARPRRSDGSLGDGVLLEHLDLLLLLGQLQLELERLDVRLAVHRRCVGRAALRLQRLSEHFGLGDAQLARLRGPIGLYIGSKTPPEIAVSIMAEVLAAKNGVALPRGMTVEEGKLAAAQPPQPLEDDGPEGITPLVCGVG